MRYQKNKDLAWVITFASFLTFLVGGIASAAMEAIPADLPQPVVLANAHLGRAFISVVSSFVRYLALAGIIYGIVAIVTWPPGPS